MIHTTALTRPVQKKFVPVNVTFNSGANVTLTGLLEYVGGGYDGSVKVMDRVVKGWGQRLGEAQSDLTEKAQAYINSQVLEEEEAFA